MDSARVFRKYLSAHTRAERMNLLPTKQRHPPLQRHSHSHSYSRLPAGGRLSESLRFHLNHFPGSHNNNNHVEGGCHCEKTPLECPVLEPPHPKDKRFKCRLKCKHPVIVVPSRPRLECRNSCNESGVKERISKSRLQPAKQREDPPLSCTEVEAKSSSGVEAKSCTAVESKSSCGLEAKSSTAVVSKSSCDPKERRISFTEPEQRPLCEQSEEVPQITRQLTTLMAQLEAQLDSEKKQKEQLNAINNQLKQLSGTVTNLNDKCKILETEKSKLKLEEMRCQCLEESQLCHKPSSMCQFCKHKTLPVLSSMHNALFQLMGQRLFTDVALTILLRADNIYHVNVRDLETGSVLGCLLVNETGIKEANGLGIFQEILTFCVIDVRSSMSTRDAIFGGINFEFVRDQRLHGGGNSSQRKHLFKEMFDPVCSLQADRAVAQTPHSSKRSREPKVTVSQAMLQIDSISKSLVLSDEEAKYPVSGIEIVSMLESSPDCSEMDRRSAH
ncbi:hypothetical protein KR044_002672 [Drosophila immigrans]|nr:hypothetical protein KR044_002672 [Drosophila immigrans]